jgi:zinc transport system ATP-binding protein
LTLGYDGKAVVSGLTFDVHTGDYLCVVGENGSGKTTLMRTLLGLSKPMSGVIVAERGFDAREIGYLPQQNAAQKDFPASVREVVRSGCLNGMGMRPFYTGEQKRAAEDNMEKLGIADLAGRCFYELSGGQQRRVLLARALCAAGRLLLMDEPVTGLDPQAAADMYDIIEKLNKDGLTVIMISHDIAAALKYASHILHLGEAHAVYFGPADKYSSSVSR